jgi:glycerophosphoryl diester phosphodiesterase
LPSWVPTLGEALGVCAGAIVNVEIKGSGDGPGPKTTEKLAERTMEALRAVGEMPGEPQEEDVASRPSHLLVSSFSTTALRVANAVLRSTQNSATRPAPSPAPGPLRGELPVLGLLVPPGADVFAAVDEAAELGCGAFNPFFAQVTADLVVRAHDAGMAVVTWTVNDPTVLQAVVGAGVDAVVSDEVESSRALLGR